MELAHKEQAKPPAKSKAVRRAGVARQLEQATAIYQRENGLHMNHRARESFLTEEVSEAADEILEAEASIGELQRKAARRQPRRESSRNGWTATTPG